MKRSELKMVQTVYVLSDMLYAQKINILSRQSGGGSVMVWDGFWVHDQKKIAVFDGYQKAEGHIWKLSEYSVRNWDTYANFLSSWSNQRILVHEITTNEGAEAQNSANQNHVINEWL